MAKNIFNSYLNYGHQSNGIICSYYKLNIQIYLLIMQDTHTVWVTLKMQNIKSTGSMITTQLYKLHLLRYKCAEKCLEGCTQIHCK